MRDILKCAVLSSAVLLASCQASDQTEIAANTETMTYVACVSYLHSLKVLTVLKPSLSEQQIKAVDQSIDVMVPICAHPEAASSGDLDIIKSLDAMLEAYIIQAQQSGKVQYSM